MSARKVTDLADVRAGDVVTARFIETGEEITATTYHPETAPTGWVSLLGWPLSKGNGKFGLGITKFELISVTRPVPEVEPGTVGTATVRGVEGVRGTWANFGAEGLYFAHHDIESTGDLSSPAALVTDFVPDPDAPALRAEVERLEVERDGYRNDAMTHLADARRLSARADAAEARLAGACAAIAGQITSWEAENSERWAEVHTSVKVAIDAAQYAIVENLRDLLALVAADEQTAEGEGERWPLVAGSVVSGEGNTVDLLNHAPVGTVVRGERAGQWTRASHGWGNAKGGWTSEWISQFGPLTVVTVGGAS